ncbi:lectin subunit alpha-like isoform X2 [Armigeres subalbatus]|uniref:lectin subunit alpha-like isoform X2 n=1 Tax=Armigeres subalbatus TaxID=124917 RepID=UPI002ED4059E
MMEYTTFALIIAVFCATVNGVVEYCEQTSKFHIPSVKANWIGAVEYCNRINMRLAIVDSAAKSVSVLDAINSAKADGLTFANVWIGANDMAKEGTFTWHSTGQPVKYTNWSATNPDNHQGRENCVEIAFKDYTQWKWAWNDNKCDAVLYFVFCLYFSTYRNSFKSTYLKCI